MVTGNANPPVGEVRRRRPQARSLDTKQRIFEAAAREFATKGFEGASTRAIAASAGVNHPIVTYHYQSKIGLWQAVLTGLNEIWDRRYTERLAGLRGVDDLTTLRLILEEFIYFSAEHPEFHWLMSDAARAPSPRLDWLTETFLQPKVSRVTALIALAQERGKFIAGDPVHLFYVFIGAVTRVFMVDAEMRSVTNVSTTDPGFVERHVDICMRLVFRMD